MQAVQKIPLGILLLNFQALVVLENFNFLSFHYFFIEFFLLDLYISIYFLWQIK